MSGVQVQKANWEPDRGVQSTSGRPILETSDVVPRMGGTAAVLCSLSVVAVERAAESFATEHWSACFYRINRRDQLVSKSLMVPLKLVVSHEFRD